MTRPRVFISPQAVRDGLVHLAGQQAHYLSRVVRLTPGRRFWAAIPGGAEFEVEVISARGQEVIGRIVAQLAPAPAAPAARIILAQAILKPKAMAFAIQKITELGVSAIVPLQASRSQVRLRGDDAEKKLQRWQQIAAEAARQSRRREIPTIHQPMTIASLAQSWRDMCDRLLVLDPDAPQARPMGAALASAASACIVVGPEGGLTAGELRALASAGATPVSLGPNILRAETAAVVACALALYELGGLQ